ncbi:hypothetical protein C1645_824682 [Glomus cerebriforme]|uniref:Uncharacterized protein n=1 Tax=Glomus cerebriforme TaxID=658196 RepID=A0A397STY7_9GLOM|nr:hypothetical protein C1645_824682 [Glomus cerebriforme]
MEKPILRYLKKILEKNSGILSKNGYIIMNGKLYKNSHLKRCISENTISNKHARRKEVLQSIDKREFNIWQYKQYILQEEKDKLVLVSYDNDCHSTSYETYMQVKSIIAKNTMSAYISNARQKIVSPISYHVLNQRSEALSGPTFLLLLQKLSDSLGNLNVTGLLGRTGLRMLPDSLGELDLECYQTP